MQRNLFWIYIAVLLFSPLAFGAVETWSLAIMEVMAISAVWIFITSAKTQKKSLYETPGLVPLLCFGVFYLIQIIPMPPFVVKIISPEAFNIHMNTIGVFEPDSWISLSVQKKATLLEFFRFISYAAFYILTVQQLTQKDTLKKTVSIIIMFAGVLAFFAAIQGITSNGKLFWVRETAYGNIYGPFVNRNHFAGLMGMLFPVALGIFLGLKPKANYGSLREKISDFLNQRRTGSYMLAGLAAILIAISTILSLSRGGIVCLGLSTLVMAFLLLFRTRNRGRAITILVVALIIVLSVGWVGWSAVSERFSKIRDIQGNISDFRPEIWKNTISMIRDFLVPGTGFGTFVSVYPKYRSISTDWILDHAHNDYLELIAEGGIISFLLVACFFISVFYKSYNSLKKRKDAYSIYLYIGCISGMLSILFFSMSDFNLHIGSNGLYFFFLAGLAVSAANTRLHEGLSPTYLKPAPVSKFKILQIVLAGLIVVCLIFYIGILTGEYYFSQIKDIKADRLSKSELMKLDNISKRASLFDPLEAKYEFVSGNIEMRLAGKDAAIASYKQAIFLDPLNGEYLQKLGLAVSERGELEKGEKLIKAGIAYDISNASRYKFYTLYLFSKGRKEEALSYIKQALIISPEKSEDLVMLMMLKGLGDDEMKSALPERAGPYLAFADYLALSGKDAAAENIYKKALFYISQENIINRAYFDKEYNYYMKRSLFDEALKVMKRATAAFPNDGELHYRTGTLYEKLGMSSMALEEYKAARKLDQTLVEAGKRIEAISAASGRSTD